MRTKFIDQLSEEMRKDDSLFFVVADMGLGIVEKFQEEFPNHFINVGIAEQNMIGVCAGLCNLGFRPIAYTISNFLVQRSFEQIRNDICLHDYPIILVGASTGFDNGKLGPTHQVIDDIGCLKALPEISIYSPSTVSATKLVFSEILDKKKPAYLRIGKGSFNVEIKTNDINQMVKTSDQSDILVITHGNILENCMQAANDNPIFSIYCMNRIKPLENEIIKNLFNNHSRIIVIEDQMKSSGLFNVLCQFLVEFNLYNTKLYSIASPDHYEKKVGDREHFARKYGFTSQGINKFISRLS